MVALISREPSYANAAGSRADEAFMATFGEEACLPEVTDLRDTKCLVLVGSHIGENMHNGRYRKCQMPSTKML
ncbi:MAG: hypothetical protein U0X39_09270 [Bacteroidales bacterium]